MGERIETGTALEDVRDGLPADDDWDERFALADQAELPVDEEQTPE